MVKKLAAIIALAVVATGCANTSTKMYQGLGKDSYFREGPGKDNTGHPVYSFNYTYTAVLFDENGKIVNANMDALEVTTPNYKGESSPHFAGWPGTPGYNVVNHETLEVGGISDNSLANVKAQVDGWITKGERGDEYGMNPKNDWHKQMAFYTNWFKGKTVDEIEAIWKRAFSDKNGRPIKATTTDAAEKAKYDKLTEADKKMLADITAGATMSLNDNHGNMLKALRDAYNNRVEVKAAK